mgnify:CR=1 FL=1
MSKPKPTTKKTRARERFVHDCMPTLIGGPTDGARLLPPGQRPVDSKVVPPGAACVKTSTHQPNAVRSTRIVLKDADLRAAIRLYTGVSIPAGAKVVARQPRIGFGGGEEMICIVSDGDTQLLTVESTFSEEEVIS